jgi:hypothetical protein
MSAFSSGRERLSSRDSKWDLGYSFANSPIDMQMGEQYHADIFWTNTESAHATPNLRSSLIGMDKRRKCLC